MAINLSHSENFSSVDAAWLHMDTPSNLANITGVMSFPTPLNFARLRATIEARLLPYIRFRQRISEPSFPLGLPRWELDPNFDLNYHLQATTLSGTKDHSALQDFVSELMSMPLDRSRPLWQFHYIDEVAGGSALVSRLHHCIADGVALTQVLLSLADETAEAPWPVAPEPVPGKPGSPARFCKPAILVAKTVKGAVHTTGTLLHEGMQVLVKPSRLGSAANSAAAGSLAFSKLLLLPPDHRTLFKQKCSVPKRAAWSTEISLEDVKNVGRTMGGTINDILLSAVTGALRRYLIERGDPVQGVNIRAMVPVNLRPEEEEGELGNRFGLIYLSLPIGASDPLRRLVILRKRMNAIKNSPEAVVAFGILNVIGLTPVQVEKLVIKIFGIKGSAVMTNVPGPRQTLYLAGAPITSMIFWVPSPANLSLGVSILSYAGDVILGVATDANIVPDPERIIELFQVEFQYLQKWGQPPANP